MSRQEHTSGLSIYHYKDGPGRIRCRWNDAELNLLIWYIKQVKQAQQAKRPGTVGVSGIPFPKISDSFPDPIKTGRASETKWTHLRKDYFTVKLLRELPGFQWDASRHLLVADNAVWKELQQSHPKKAKWRYRPFPWFDDICMLLDDSPVNAPPGSVISTPAPRPPINPTPAVFHYNAYSSTLNYQSNGNHKNDFAYDHALRSGSPAPASSGSQPSISSDCPATFDSENRTTLSSGYPAELSSSYSIMGSSGYPAKLISSYSTMGSSRYPADVSYATPIPQIQYPDFITTHSNLDKRSASSFNTQPVRSALSKKARTASGAFRKEGNDGTTAFADVLDPALAAIDAIDSTIDGRARRKLQGEKCLTMFGTVIMGELFKNQVSARIYLDHKEDEQRVLWLKEQLERYVESHGGRLGDLLVSEDN